MTRISRRTALALPLAPLLFAGSSVPIKAATHRYLIDPSASEVRFTYQFNGVPGNGAIAFGTTDIALDLANLDRSSVDVRLRANTVKAGFLPATEALRSAALLDARAHPEIRFKSTRVEARGLGAILTGDLSIKGVTRTEAFTARYIGDVPPADATRLGIQLDAQIDRHAYNINGFSDFVDPVVAFRIRIALTRQS